MTYLQEVDAWLDEQIMHITAKSDLYALKAEILNRILQSFHNGQRACPNCKPRTPRRPAPAS